ncbi:MAG: DNA polymerase I, partial [Treponema sp.]|nr:DNA polymerase I [Treponema sp.]
YGLIYRSYFAFLTRPLRNSAGKNVSALFGFARTVISLLNDGAPVAVAGDSGDGTGGDEFTVSKEPPALLVSVLDSQTPTFRHRMYGDYKATRQKTPEDLHAQVPLVEEFLTTLNIASIRADGYEADDIIATLAQKCREEGRQCYILSSDKDLLQLIGDGVYALRPAKAAKGEIQAKGNIQAGPAWELIGPAQVKTEWGLMPEKILDLLSLCGDASDNVPGVKGIGEKTAVELLGRYGSLDEIYRNIASIQGAKAKRLAEGKESAYFSQSLIRLETKVPLPADCADGFSTQNINRQAAARMLFREGIRQSAKQLDPAVGAAGDAAPAAAAVSADPPPLPGAPGTDSGTRRDDAGERQDPSIYVTYSTDKSLFGSGEYRTVLDLAELETILGRAGKQKLVAIDFETDSLDAWNSRPIGVSLALKPKEAFYVPLAPHGVSRRGEDEIQAPPSDPQHNDPEKVRALLAPLFADPEMTVVAHNAKYDYKVTRGWGMDRWRCKIWDTMVAAWLSDPERNNYSLDSLAAYTFDYTPVAYYDIVPKGQAFDVVSLETATRYAAEDSDMCLRLMRHFEPLLAGSDTMRLFETLEMPLLPVLAETEGTGIKIEAEVLTGYGRELEVDLGDIQRQSWEMAGREFNLSSTKQLQEILFVDRKLTPGKKTKTGYSTDAASLEELAREDPLPALILRHRTLAKLKSTYVDTLAGMADEAGRLHTNFDQCGTATGRLSSREPNLQNIPVRAEEGRRIREAFVASPGCLLISADYSQIELVVLAHLSRDENLIAAFRDGTDVHVRTAALIFGTPEDQVKNDQRRIAKTINFGVMYGMSAFRLANELGISRNDASRFIDAYFGTYSGVRRFIEELIAKTEACGYASTILGRRRYIRTINSRNKTEKAAAERIAVNTPIQGSAADIVKTAMLNLDRRLAAEQSPARLLLQVHDELILECPAETVAETTELVKTEMEQALTLSIPLRVSVETGTRWGSFH